MHYLAFFIILLFFSSLSLSEQSAEPAGNSKKDLYDQEKIAQQNLDKIFTDKSYQQICLKQMDKISIIYNETNILKGDISRIYFFCESEYNYKLTRRQRRGFEIWDMKDPVSIFECQRENQLKDKKMPSNPYIINRC
jgi:endonuclease I